MSETKVCKFCQSEIPKRQRFVRTVKNIKTRAWLPY